MLAATWFRSQCVINRTSHIHVITSIPIHPPLILTPCVNAVTPSGHRKPVTAEMVLLKARIVPPCTGERSSTFTENPLYTQPDSDTPMVSSTTATDGLWQSTVDKPKSITAAPTAPRTCSKTFIALNPQYGGVPSAFCEMGSRKILGSICLAAVGCGWPVLWANLCLHWV